MMDTAKKYKDSEGIERTIMEMIIREPEWAAERLQVGERAIERLALITPKGIQWVGDCDRCEGRGENLLDMGHCVNCKGTGKITRPATFEEFIQIGMQAIKDIAELQSQCSKQGFEPNKNYIINGGTLQVEEG